jgi:CubicO group peptidase (beta-lactamase class C family)
MKTIPCSTYGVLGRAIALSLAGCAPLEVASGYVSHLACSGTFVSGLATAQVVRETVAATEGMGLVSRALHYEVDRDHQSVRTAIGPVESVSVYREGRGCLLLHDSTDRAAHERATRPAHPAAQQAGAREERDAAPLDPALAAALERAFAETPGPPKRTKAIVVMHEGTIVAERYAAPVTADTPMLGFSLSKSIINALVGILVRDGVLAIDAPADVAEWRSPDDPRRAITIDDLLRHTSGLDIAETNTGFDPNTRILFLSRDTAGAAARAPLLEQPGSAFHYASGNTLILARIVRDAVGGSEDDFRRFAQRALFDPLGMAHVTIETDAVGNPLGSMFIFASARDWARFGALYAERGVIDGQHILSEDWVAYASSQTRDSPYAAGFWLGEPSWRQQWDVPDDLFLASGSLGQKIAIIPSERLVIVRLGLSSGPNTMDLGGLGQLVHDVRKALRPGMR